MDKDENKSGERLAHAFDRAFFPADGYDDFNDMPHDVCFGHMTDILSSVRKVMT
jgi:hypothetical protein